MAFCALLMAAMISTFLMYFSMRRIAGSRNCKREKGYREIIDPSAGYRQSLSIDAQSHQTFFFTPAKNTGPKQDLHIFFPCEQSSMDMRYL
ncbi:uncharacterized protein Bfra_009067 [Botrytis fragariae]|uniref:Uncharacterized protein n=1 Tax=Botrytis fragariae TaxID=1964551 RepID=A0A8H6EH24_9HELO|nr:uncharacterized protein Bfra_009067 [Botrytis fragariae]KAF5872039.1 hypothetical protein Bfra_009067 [Botrytis fragariae]